MQLEPDRGGSLLARIVDRLAALDADRASASASGNRMMADTIRADIDQLELQKTLLAEGGWVRRGAMQAASSARR